MAKKSKSILILVVLIIAGYLFYNHTWVVENDIVYLKSGDTIIAENTWEGGNLVYYEKDGTTRILFKEDVELVSKKELRQSLRGRDIILRYAKKGERLFTTVFNISNFDMNMFKAWVAENRRKALPLAAPVP